MEFDLWELRLTAADTDSYRYLAHGLRPVRGETGEALYTLAYVGHAGPGHRPEGGADG